MSGKSSINILVALLISMLLSSCITYKYSRFGVPNVRKADKYNDDIHIDTFYQIYDINTSEWYEAEKNDAGEWDLTDREKRRRQMKIEERYWIDECDDGCGMWNPRCRWGYRSWLWRR